jgi:hypothetical protein
MTETSQPTQPRNPVVRATRAAQALRELGATTASSGYQDPPELYNVLVQLTQVVERSGQVLVTAGEWLRAEHRAGRVGADEAGIQGVITAAIDALTAATAQAAALATQLDTAAGHAGHLTRTD